MTTLVPASSQKRLLDSTTRAYESALRSPSGEQAYAYLREDRALSEETLARYRVGFVDQPADGHSAAAGFISIPYVTPTGVVDIRFRRPPGSDKPYKYYTLPGRPTRIFGTGVLAAPGRVVAITEGEIDAMSSTQAGLPAVGIPGVKAWKEYYARIFAGFERVLIFTDNDDRKDGEEEGVGQKFANVVAKDLAEVGVSADTILMPEGHDVNSFLKENGEHELRIYAGA